MNLITEKTYEYIDFLSKQYITIYNSTITSPDDNLFIIIMMTALPIFFIISKTRVGRGGLLFILTFLGTVLHEFLHFFIGLITFAHPVSFSLIPKKTEGGWTLGSVSFANLNQLNALPVAMAPLLAPIFIILTFPLCLDYIRGHEYEMGLSLAYSFALVSGINQCFPSSTDFQVMFSKKVGLLFYILLFYYIGLQIYKNFF